ncbi:RNA-directed DNA polymerase from mobile element jockey [Trichonephila clavipes]|nr:RNA-directed DNA polymerase from mobile element jockey [Trichonephila clavipes]
MSEAKHHWRRESTQNACGRRAHLKTTIKGKTEVQLKTPPIRKLPLTIQASPPQFKLNDIQNPHKDEVITNIVDAYLITSISNTDPYPPPSALPSEIINFIKKIKIQKSPGRVGITNKMLKYLPLLTVFKFTNIINDMLNLRYFPSAWKTAVVVPILKPGKNPKLAESHRPISLLPVLSNLAEKIIHASLNDYLESKSILIPEQHGIRPRLSTTHQLLRVVQYIKEGNNRGQYTAAVFLDIQKAFNRVWHTGLLFKLITYEVPPPLILLINSFISNRIFSVKINRIFSQIRSVKTGIGQGSILGQTKLNRRSKLLIYSLILKPLLTYVSSVWGHAARTNINLLESSQNVILRQILDAHWYMSNLRAACKIPTIRQTIRKLASNFFNNIDGHENPSIQDIPSYFSRFSVRRPSDVLVNLHWCAKIKDEVEKLAYQLNEEAERTE